jgi:hypothetical protein
MEFSQATPELCKPRQALALLTIRVVVQIETPTEDRRLVARGSLKQYAQVRLFI